MALGKRNDTSSEDRSGGTHMAGGSADAHRIPPAPAE
jgi:hypothetical protein